MKRRVASWGRKLTFVTGCLLAALVALAPGTAGAGARLCYVDASAIGSDDGSSWADAYPDLQTALSDATCVEICVAQGTYKPTSGGDRTATFKLKSGVAVYGGFRGGYGTESDWEAYPTILSGEIGTEGDAYDNSYHVVTSIKSNYTAILDGFVITGGHADGDSQNGYGGGMYTYGGDGPTLSHVIFSGNFALYGGGGMYNQNSRPKLSNVTFKGNSGANGGGMYNIYSASPELSNVIFIGNSAPYGSGGGIYSESSNCTLSNVTFSKNYAQDDGWGINGNATVSNCILWGDQGGRVWGGEISSGNASVTYSLVQGGYPGEGNVASDPQFVDANNGDLHLQPTSPALNAGSNNLIARDLADLDRDWDRNEPVPYDFAGSQRIRHGIVDMGAYECPLRVCVGEGWNGNSVCRIIYTDLREALSASISGEEIWVAKGTYKPTSGLDRLLSFQLKNGVAVFGGFAGSETRRSDRDWVANETILSGDGGEQGYSGDNSFHVVTGNYTDRTAVLDGFVITGGNAGGVYWGEIFGGGVIAVQGSPTLGNLIIRDNSASWYGGGMYSGGGNPALANVIFVGNSASNGGAMYNRRSNAQLSNVIFTRNSAGCGGGICNVEWSRPTLSNVTFHGNSAHVAGGGIYSSGQSAAMLFNSILWENSGGEIHNEADSSTSVTYSMVKGGYDGEGNLSTDPLFVDADHGNLRLRLGSPAVKTGSNAHVARDFTDLDADGDRSELVPYDLAGKQRIMDSSVDMGAYEHAPVRCVGEDWPQGWGTRVCNDISRDLQDALEHAVSGEEIWVEKGTYWSNPRGYRMESFRLKNGVAVYGGFTGNETARSDRDWAANPTILSGDLAHNDSGFANNDDNSYHVVTASSTDKTAILDGFVIAGGNADDASGAYSEGGGMYNSGGSPTLSNLTFRYNSAFLGGGMYNAAAGPTLSNVAFTNNLADQGGAMFNSGPSGPMISNTTFTGNTATTGGGMFNADIAGMQVSHSIFWGNGGGEIHNAGSSPSVVYSLVQGGYDGEGNLDSEESPFLDASNGDLRLKEGTPAIDSGNNALAARDYSDMNENDDKSEPAPYDLAGGPRIVNGTVDMGAHEYQGAATAVELEYFRAVRSNGEILVKWKTASETGNAGFHVWRCAKKNGSYARITEGPIPAKGSPFEGARYSFADTEAEMDKTYFYKLEDIDINGVSTFHGPVKVRDRR